MSSCLRTTWALFRLSYNILRLLHFHLHLCLILALNLFWHKIGLSCLKLRFWPVSIIINYDYLSRAYIGNFNITTLFNMLILFLSWSSVIHLSLSWQGLSLSSRPAAPVAVKWPPAASKTVLETHLGSTEVTKRYLFGNPFHFVFDYLSML